MKTAIVTLSLLAFFTATLQVSAQHYTTHAVKEGESLQSIAQTYSVTPYALLQANKELKNASDVKANTLLIIPLKDSGVAPPEAPEQKVPQTIQTPIGFIRHKVQRKETLFSLARRYQVTEEKLKRYNPKLYAEPLKKRMILKIPRYPQPSPKAEQKQDPDFEIHTVQSQETQWSIAHQYGITVDSLVALNPELRQGSEHLGIGQVLRLPKHTGREVHEQAIAPYISYTVPSQMTLYSLGKAYNLSLDTIVQLNPAITEKGGLQEGMVLRLPKPQTPAVNTQNYTFYEVQPKQNLFNLTRTLKVSSDTLFRLNPDLEKGLKAGMVLKLPKAQTQTFEGKEALVLDKVNLIDSIRVENRPKVVFMLPFRLDKIDFDDLDKTRSQIAGRKDISLSLGLYSGALVALDSIEKHGVSVAVRTYDTELSREKVREILAKDSLSGVNAIIGPLAPNILHEVASVASAKNIPVIAPIPSTRGLGYGNVFFSWPQEEVLRKTVLSYLDQTYDDQNIIVIADSTHIAAHTAILARFPMAQTATLIDDRSLDLEEFLPQLSPEKENWVFLETQRPSTVASVTSVLNSASTQEAPVRLFTTSYNSAFETDALSNAHLSNIQFTYATAYKVVDHNTFVKAYQKRFNGLKPDRYAMRGFAITFDVLLKLAHTNDLFETTKMVGLTEYTGNRFNYVNQWDLGYYNKACYLMEYDTLQIKEIPHYDFQSNL